MKKIILYDSDESAHKETRTLEGWISSNGTFFAGYNAEHNARYSSCTHIKCPVCGEVYDKTYAYCPKCHEKECRENYLKLPKIEWDGKCPLMLEDMTFYDIESLHDFCKDMECQPNTLELYLTEPVYAKEIETSDLYYDDFAEDQTIDDFPELKEQIEKLNRWIRKNPTVLSYEAINKRPDIEDFS